MRVGDIVKTPSTELTNGPVAAIVTAINNSTVTINTGRFELIFDKTDLAVVATIKLGKAYGNYTGRRLRRCEVCYMTGDKFTIDVQVRGPNDLGTTIQALSVRKLAFLQLIQTPIAEEVE